MHHNSGVHYLKRAIPVLGLGAVLSLAFFLAPFEPQAQESEPAVRRVVAKMRSLSSFQAKVTINTSEGGGLSGTLHYQNGKTHFKLRDGRVIASDGHFLTVYSPSSSVAGKQEMYSSGGGLGWLLSGFESKVIGHSARLKALKPDRSVQEVRLIWHPDFTLSKISFRRKKSEGWTTIIFNSITPIKNISPTMFSWRPPAGSRTVENPLNQKN